MNYQNYLFCALLCALQIHGICNRSDRNHADPNIVRCLYHQEDIYRCYSKKLHCYEVAERCKECFFCGCPIEEHTKKEVQRSPRLERINKNEEMLKKKSKQKK